MCLKIFRSAKRTCSYKYPRSLCILVMVGKSYPLSASLRDEGIPVKHFAATLLLLIQLYNLHVICSVYFICIYGLPDSKSLSRRHMASLPCILRVSFSFLIITII